MPRPAPIRPPALQPGDTIGIVASASNIDRKPLAAGCDELRRMGYVPYFLDSIFERDLYFAGSVARRVSELEHMFENPSVRAIVCARGGYGANHLLPHLDLRKILANPKPFIGYSDITTLLTYFTDHGLVTFHGPMATKDFAHTGGVEIESWQAVLSSAANYEYTLANGEVEPLAEGTAEGVLYGGCLSLLVASLGTPYEIKTARTILFIEDVNAKPYQVDRMLMQLKLAGKLEGVRGVIFGEMLECAQPGGQDYTLQEVIRRVFSEFRIPIAYGLRSGHVTKLNRTLPLGVQARLEAGREVRLSCDAAVIPARAMKESSNQ
jgi:muramoyltetrapeptide carboxypeptidase